MPCILPARPGFSPSPGSSTHRTTERVRNVTPGLSSPALMHHPSGLPLHSPLPYPRLRPTRSHPRKVPRRSSRTLRHFRIPRPFFPRPLPKPRPESLASLPGSPALRVWLPSRRPQPAEPSEASFSPQHPWASPSRAFLLPGDRSRVSPRTLRSCASLQNLSALHRRSSGFLPPEKPCPFSLPERLIRVGASCSPGTSSLSGLPSADPTEKLLPSRSPSRPSKPENLAAPRPPDPRVSPLSGSASSPKGRLPVWPSSPSTSAAS
jgi:hypothetical protein